MTVLASGVAVVVALAATYPLALGAFVRARVLPAAQQRLGRHVTAADVSVGLGRVVLEDVVVTGPEDPRDEPLMRAARVDVRFPLLPALAGRLHLSQVTFERVRLYADGRDNVRDVIHRLRGRGVRGAGRERPTLIVQQGSAELRDEERGFAARAGSIDGTLRPHAPAHFILADVRATIEAGPALAIDHVTANVPLTVMDAQGPLPEIELSGGSFAPLHSLALTGIRGTLKPAGAPGRIAIDLRGGYGGVPEELWTAGGEVLVRERRAQLDVTAARFTLDKLKPILAGTPIIAPESASVDASLKIHIADGLVAFEGGLQVSGLALFHLRLAPIPVRDLDGLAQVRGSFAVAERRLRLDEALVTFRSLHLQASGEASQIGRPNAQYAARLRVPPVPCQVALAALPQELTPALQGFRLRGTFQLDLHTKIDMQNLDQTELGGDVGIRGCQVLEAPPTATKLDAPFEHRVEIAPGKELAFTVGPDNPDFVPFADISPALFAALTTTEDGAFFFHRGFIPSTFRAALIRNLRRGQFALGASSITMQMVKNAFLAREKTLARKLQELFLTWFVEGRLKKDRIMEVYLNIIEFGPALYGIGPATRHYFGKPASQVTPLEAAFFASILPNPKKRYVQFCRGQLSPDWDKYVRRILLRMRERGRISDDEYQQQLSGAIVFNRDEFPGERECHAAIVAATGPPRPLDRPEEDEEAETPSLTGAESDPAQPRTTNRPSRAWPRTRAETSTANGSPTPRQRLGKPPGTRRAPVSQPARPAQPRLKIEAQTKAP
jgi:hypothetical protein